MYTFGYAKSHGFLPQFVQSGLFCVQPKGGVAKRFLKTVLLHPLSYFCFVLKLAVPTCIHIVNNLSHDVSGC